MPQAPLCRFPFRKGEKRPSLSQNGVFFHKLLKTRRFGCIKEEGVSREISIGAGEEVFLRFAALERNQKYTVKSTGDADTYGELYDGSSSPLTSADGGRRGRKLFHHVHQIFRDLLSGRKTDGQDGFRHRRDHLFCRINGHTYSHFIDKANARGRLCRRPSHVLSSFSVHCFSV